MDLKLIQLSKRNAKKHNNIGCSCAVMTLDTICMIVWWKDLKAAMWNPKLGFWKQMFVQMWIHHVLSIFCKFWFFVLSYWKCKELMQRILSPSPK